MVDAAAPFIYIIILLVCCPWFCFLSMVEKIFGPDQENFAYKVIEKVLRSIVTVSTFFLGDALGSVVAFAIFFFLTVAPMGFIIYLMWTIGKFFIVKAVSLVF